MYINSFCNYIFKLALYFTRLYFLFYRFTEYILFRIVYRYYCELFIVNLQKYISLKGILYPPIGNRIRLLYRFNGYIYKSYTFSLLLCKKKKT